MTIIAGFKCDDGIVICSDTQETIQSAKRSIPKLRFEPSDRDDESERCGSNLAAAFCGAGSGPMIDKLVDTAWSAASKCKSLNEACLAIEKAIANQYRHLGRIYQTGSCPEVQLIYGVKMNGKSRLFSAWGPLVNEKFGFDSGGVGHYMADFLGSKLHHRALTINQCVILSAYVLYEAKEYVEGCGGESQIVVLRNRGSSGTVSYFSERPLTEAIGLMNTHTGEILMTLADIEKSPKRVNDEITFGLELMNRSRTRMHRGFTEGKI